MESVKSVLISAEPLLGCFTCFLLNSDRYRNQTISWKFVNIIVFSLEEPLSIVLHIVIVQTAALYIGRAISVWLLPWED